MSLKNINIIFPILTYQTYPAHTMNVIFADLLLVSRDTPNMSYNQLELRIQNTSFYIGSEMFYPFVKQCLTSQSHPF